MKKILYILLLIFLLEVTNVHASNYKLKELIPIKETTTIVTERFSYRKIGFDEKVGITFSSIKNLYQEKLPISISIGLFDKEKKNIGTIYYCSSKDQLLPKEEREYTISVEDYLSPKKGKKDITYIAILSDNKNCSTKNSDIFIGKKIEEIGKTKSVEISEDVSIFLKVVIVTVTLAVIPFLYRLFFTNTYENVNGDAVRKEYNYYQEKGLFKKEKETPSEKEKAKVAEEKPKKEENEESNATDLHKLYK